MVYDVNTLSDLMYKELNDGYHQVVTHDNAQNIIIDVEIVNYYDDFTLTASDSLGDNVVDARMLILKFHKNLSIPYGKIFRPQVRKKGMLVLCLGLMDVQGKVSMTARGAYAVGQNIYIARHNNTLYSISANGAYGGAQSYYYGNGSWAGSVGIDGNSTNGTMQQTGGGGGGGGYSPWNNGYYTWISAGGQGTSFSGGSGGGGTSGSYSGSYNPANDGGANGGPGGAGANGYNNYSMGGGAGNPGGSRASSSGNNGDSGTGGLLIVISYNIKVGDTGGFEARGCNGGSNDGGASGGGIVNIFCNKLIDKSVSDVYSLISVVGGSGAGGYAVGGNGGWGCKFVVNQVNFFSFLLKVDDRIYTLNETYYTTYPETIGDLNIFKTTTDISTLTYDEIKANATLNANKLIKVINILKQNGINNIKILKINL